MGYRYTAIIYYKPTWHKQQRIEANSGSINMEEREVRFLTEATHSCSAYYYSTKSLHDNNYAASGSELETAFRAWNGFGTALVLSGSVLPFGNDWEYIGTSSAGVSMSAADGWGWNIGDDPLPDNFPESSPPTWY
jgi:hypothetical protein